MRKPEKRVRRDRKQWQTLVEEWRSSGANAKEFARTHGLSTTSLYYWSSVLSRAAPAPMPKLLPVRVAAQVARSSELELWVGPARVRFDEGTSPAYVGALARALLEANAR
jgi:transposase-like protein